MKSKEDNIILFSSSLPVKKFILRTDNISENKAIKLINFYRDLLNKLSDSNVLEIELDNSIKIK